MKKIVALILAALSSMNAKAKEEIQKVFILKAVDHEALDSTTQGLKDGLEQNGYKEGVNCEVRVESAQGNAALASQIATKFVAQGADVTVGVGTAPSQSLSKFSKDGKTKLVFSSVTDPSEAGLVKSLDKPGNNTSGVSNFVDLEPQIKLFKEIQPKLKRLGFLYNPSESNSASLIKKLEKVSKTYGMELVLQTANKTSDVAQAATKLAKNVDAIFISNDNTALAALPVIIKAALKLKVPVYVSDTDAVQLGALAALGPNQYKIGVQTAENMIIPALKGKDLSTIPVGFPNDTELYLNAAAAEKLGIVLTDAVKNKATKISIKMPV